MILNFTCYNVQFRSLDTYLLIQKMTFFRGFLIYSCILGSVKPKIVNLFHLTGVHELEFICPLCFCKNMAQSIVRFAIQYYRGSHIRLFTLVLIEPQQTVTLHMFNHMKLLQSNMAQPKTKCYNLLCINQNQCVQSNE